MPPDLSYKDLLPLIWVFKYKTDSDGFITKYKSRLVARSNLQATEEETYAATVAIQTFRAITAIYTAFDLNYKSYDVINAYVNLALQKSMYYQLPPRYEKSGKMLKLLRVLYGLKNAPNLWFVKFTNILQRLGLHQVPEVNCLYTNRWLTLLFYVNDIVVFYSVRHQSEFKAFKKELLGSYQIRSLDDITSFLSIRVLRERVERKI